MRMAELLERVPGLTRNEVYYYEARDYIKPKKLKVGKIFRNEFFEEDFELISLMQEYRDQGFTPRVSYEKAQQDMNKAQQRLF